MMAEMAEAAGFAGDAKAFSEMAASNLAYMRGKFLAEDGMLLPLFRDMQTPALFALKLGILERPDAITATKAALLQNFRDHGDCPEMSPGREAACRAVFGTWGFFRTMHGNTAPSC